MLNRIHYSLVDAWSWFVALCCFEIILFHKFFCFVFSCVRCVFHWMLYCLHARLVLSRKPNRKKFTKSQNSFSISFTACVCVFAHCHMPHIQLECGFWSLMAMVAKRREKNIWQIWARFNSLLVLRCVRFTFSVLLISLFLRFCFGRWNRFGSNGRCRKKSHRPTPPRKEKTSKQTRNLAVVARWWHTNRFLAHPTTLNNLSPINNIKWY